MDICRPFFLSRFPSFGNQIVFRLRTEPLLCHCSPLSPPVMVADANTVGELPRPKRRWRGRDDARGHGTRGAAGRRACLARSGGGACGIGREGSGIGRADPPGGSERDRGASGAAGIRRSAGGSEGVWDGGGGRGRPPDDGGARQEARPAAA